MSLRVLKPGLQTTVQDLGRPNHQIDGFPTSGVMDQPAAITANLLVGNPASAAVLEFFMAGPTVEFTVSTFIALGGAGFKATLNDQPVDPNRCYQVHEGDRLAIGHAASGRIGYLAVTGGLQVAPVLGSRSTTLRLQLGGYSGRPLQAGDDLPIEEHLTLPGYYHRHTKGAAPVSKDTTATISVLKGPQWDWFDPASRESFLDTTYTVSNQSDRMGYRLSGPTLPVPDQSMLSAATVMGAIQIPASGQPIVLMADRQTTGGYPLLAVIASADLPTFTQLAPGQTVQFNLIDQAEAQTRLEEGRRTINQLAQKLRSAAFLPPYGITRVANQRIATLFEEE